MGKGATVFSDWCKKNRHEISTLVFSHSAVHSVDFITRLNMVDILLVEAVSKAEKWLGKAKREMVPEYNAMTLATASSSGHVMSRTVLLKSLDAEGFVFFTNTLSRKGQQILQNPSVALTFFWMQLYRQIHVEGRAEPVTPAEADAYWETRERASQIGAWASLQSQPLDSRKTLIERVEQYETKFSNQVIPRPKHWSGYRVVPQRIEFWQGQDHRLHDREVYSFDGQDWSQQRLYP